MITPRTFMRASLAGLVLAIGQIGTASLAQSQTATAGIIIERSLRVTAVRPMAFEPVPGNVDPVSSGAVTEAIIEVTGDPGRAYRVSLPSMIEAEDIGIIDGLTLRSETSGDITESMTGRMNDVGSDRLHVGGRLHAVPGLLISGVTAAVPMTIDYE